MKSRAILRTLTHLAPLVATFATGCGSAGPQQQPEGLAELSLASTACPWPDSLDAQERGAATAALNIAVAAAATGGPVAPQYTNTVFASQRYRIQSSGVGIEFDPTDPLYPYVSNQMKAALAVAQLDATVAKFLSDGLSAAYAKSNGWYFPSITAISALSGYRYPGPGTNVHIADPSSTNNSHYAQAVGGAWCGFSEAITINETVQDSWSYSPLYSEEITNPIPGIQGWRTTPPAAFKGYSQVPTTPFNGPGSNGNPYLFISVNGAQTNWATYNFAPVSCWGMPNATCTGSVQLDPVPYAEPGQYYDTTGNMVGTQANPFALQATVLYAVSDHQGQWATRTVNGVQEWGTFTTAYSVLGTTVYKYVKQM